MFSSSCNIQVGNIPLRKIPKNYHQESNGSLKDHRRFMRRFQVSSLNLLIQNYNLTFKPKSTIYGYKNATNPRVNDIFFGYCWAYSQILMPFFPPQMCVRNSKPINHPMDPRLPKNKSLPISSPSFYSSTSTRISSYQEQVYARLAWLESAINVV